MFIFACFRASVVEFTCSGGSIDVERKLSHPAASVSESEQSTVSTKQSSLRCVVSFFFFCFSTPHVAHHQSHSEYRHRRPCIPSQRRMKRAQRRSLLRSGPLTVCHHRHSHFLRRWVACHQSPHFRQSLRHPMRLILQRFASPTSCFRSCESIILVLITF